MPRGIYERQYKPLEHRFWEHVEKTPDCWIWRGTVMQGRSGLDYGVLWHHNTYTLCHLFSYEIATGPIPAGMLLMHSCDNPLCVRPDHLKPGTHLSNHRDKADKGRVVTGWDTHRTEMLEALSRRERVNGVFPPTPDGICAEAIRLFVDSGLTQRAVADELGVSQNMVSKALRRAGVRVPVMFKNCSPVERVGLIRQFNQMEVPT